MSQDLATALQLGESETLSQEEGRRKGGRDSAFTEVIQSPTEDLHPSLPCSQDQRKSSMLIPDGKGAGSPKRDDTFSPFSFLLAWNTGKMELLQPPCDHEVT